MRFTPNDLARVCASTVQDAGKYVEFLNAGMSHFDITTPSRVAKFLAQISYESTRLSRTEENLNYSAQRLMKVWPGRFPDITATLGFANNPQALAEKVYGGRLGNKKPGDGWLYRGRGLKQLTGLANYEAAEDGLGMLITGNNADRVALPEAAAWTACWFWYANRCNHIADSGDYATLTKVINGGLTGYEDGNDTGLDDRVEMLEYAEVKLAECWMRIT
jgi:putative chitinase